MIAASTGARLLAAAAMRAAYESDQPRDEQGRWTDMPAAAMAVMEKYKNEQAWDQPMSEYMKARGLALEDYKKANDVLYSHNVSSGEASDTALLELWDSDAPEGRALRASSDWQEWQAGRTQPLEQDYSYARQAIARNPESYRLFEGSEASGSPERFLEYAAAKERGEMVFFRKGSLDKAAISTTTSPAGARSGSSIFRPDHWFSFNEMKARGYRLLSGQRGLVGVTAGQEREHIWLKVGEIRGAEEAHPILQAADSHRAKVSVAVRYAFARGRKALRAGGDAALAVRVALTQVLEPALRRCAATGANAANVGLRDASEWREEDHPRDDEGRFTTVNTPGGSDVWYKGMYPYDFNQEVRDEKGVFVSRGPVIDPEDINRSSEFPTFDTMDREGLRIRGFFSSSPDVASHFAEGGGTSGAVYKVELKADPKRVYHIDAGGKNAGEIQFGSTGRNFRQIVRSGKYDLVVIKNTKDEGDIAVALRGTKIRNKIGSPRLLVAEFNPDQPRDDAGRWTATNAAIDALPIHDSPLGAYGYVDNPLPQEGKRAAVPAWTDRKDAVEAAMNAAGPFAQQIEHAEEVEIDIASLRSYQTRIHPDALRGHMHADGTGARGAIFEHAGINWIVDGNHRLALDMLAGKTRARVMRLRGVPAEMKVAEGRARYEPSNDDFRAAKRAAPKLKMRFDAKDPDVAKWARRHAAELIDDITETTRKRIKALVAGQGDLNATIEEIARAVGDEDRAEVIARTETMRAAHAGQRVAWERATEEGLLPESAQRTWIVTPDDRLCPVCEPLDGELAGMDDEYAPGVDGPPAHPNCRCTEGLYL